MCTGLIRQKGHVAKVLRGWSLVSPKYADESESTGTVVRDVGFGAARCVGKWVLAAGEERAKQQAGCHLDAASEEMPALKSSPSQQQGSRFDESTDQ